MTRQNGAYDNNGHGDDELIAVTDPVEGAFRISIPGGWQGRAFLYRTQSVIRPIVAAGSPDGGTHLFLNDPTLPSFMEPNELINEYNPAAYANPLFRVQRFVPAEPFFLHYVYQRYGQLSGFQITGADPNPVYGRKVQESTQKSGLNLYITAVRVAFTFIDSGKILRGIVNGTTSTTGQVWLADVSGMTTTGDPARYESLLFHVVDSLQMNPQWEQQERARNAQQAAWNQMQHQNTMATIHANTQAMTMQHQSNMAQIHSSAQQHQMRMDAIHAASDAQMNNWYAQQAQSDASHQRFMNTVNGPHTVGGNGTDSDWSHQRFVNRIKEENTVVASDGQTYQVEAGYERYYKHKTENTYIGADSTTERSDLQARMGVNPDDYEEVTVRR